jgi:transcriptional regulator with XRE-family HTH domain
MRPRLLSAQRAMLAPVTRAKVDPALATVLARLRKERGLSREVLAVRSGVTTPTLARIELGRSSPAFSTVRSICRTLGVTLEELGRLVEAEPESE